MYLPALVVFAPFFLPTNLGTLPQQPSLYLFNRRRELRIERKKGRHESIVITLSMLLTSGSCVR